MSRRNGYVCNLKKGHDGLHIASAGKNDDGKPIICLRWQGKITTKKKNDKPNKKRVYK